MWFILFDGYQSLPILSGVDGVKEKDSGMQRGVRKRAIGVKGRVNFHANETIMSQAFVREGDDQWLSDVPPTLNALIVFLTRENNGVRVYEKENKTDALGRQIHVMSNGLSYFKDDKHIWQILM